jgi:hypothetical protein
MKHREISRSEYHLGLFCDSNAIFATRFADKGRELARPPLPHWSTTAKVKAQRLLLRAFTFAG